MVVFGLSHRFHSFTQLLLFLKYAVDATRSYQTPLFIDFRHHFLFDESRKPLETAIKI